MDTESFTETEENVECHHCASKFSVVMGEKWARCILCIRWSREDCGESKTDLFLCNPYFELFYLIFFVFFLVIINYFFCFCLLLYLHNYSFQYFWLRILGYLKLEKILCDSLQNFVLIFKKNTFFVIRLITSLFLWLV